MPDAIATLRLDAKEVANMMGCKASLVYKLVARKQITHYRIGGTLSFEAGDVAEYLANARRPQCESETA